ncbi:uncharacterized protein B0I36DRAFT_334332 [Microdochium trichocladiopsis]|uniref:Jacalin-type lectin domain-containing protein n=1 Tax=Microdochium trichocladiopsis TaxID=1682393 RepID=A0A9P9BI97_9PEZI|nr:uncharacterized protein B0I36DRAFT_334332 [Microdochium trichocladiopsis]KAH7021355.1 hypothetical protein B0I36DRAFT_334332 [Microdochium trichocladiopsis]
MKWYATIPLLCSLASAASWSSGIWQNQYYIGGEGGDPFTAVAEEGQVVSKLRVYKSTKDDIYLRGIKLFYTDNTEKVIGSELGDWDEHAFEAGEVVKSMSLWGDGKGKRTGRIKFTTDKGEFDFGKDTKGQQEYPIDVGSGILIGFGGRAGSDIDQLAAIFIKGLKQRYFDNIKYADFDIGSGFELETIKQSDVLYQGSQYTYTFTGTQTFTKSSTFTYSITNSLSIGTTFKAGVPEVAEISVSAEWTISGTVERGETETTTDTLTWSIAVNVTDEASQRRCTASYYKGNVDVSWTGDFVLIDNDGNEYRIPVSGSTKSVDASKVIASCEPLGQAGKRTVYETITGPAAATTGPPTTLLKRAAPTAIAAF